MRLAVKCCIAVLSVAVCAGQATAAAEHPFMLWTRDEAARMRRQIETEAWAKEAYKRASAELAAHAIPKARFLKRAFLLHGREGDRRWAD